MRYSILFLVILIMPLVIVRSQENTAAQTNKAIGEIDWSPNSKTLAVADTEGLWLYDATDWTAKPQLLAQFDTIPERPNGIAFGPFVEFSPDGQMLAFSNGYTIRLLDVQEEIELSPVRLPEENLVVSMAFSPDGEYLVTSSHLRLLFWNTHDWTIEKTWESPRTNDYTMLEAVIFSPDGSLLATNGNYRSNIHLWNPKSTDIGDAEIANLGNVPYDDLVTDVSFSPDGKMVASASSTFSTVHIFDLDTLQERDLPDGIGGISLDFSADSRYLAIGNSGVGHPVGYFGPTCVYLYDVENEELAETWEGHESVRMLRFSPDGQTLAAVSVVDASLRLWDMEKRQQITILQQARIIERDNNETPVPCKQP